MTYTCSWSSAAVSRNIQYMHENVFDLWKKWIGKKYVIVKFNRIFYIHNDNNFSKTILSAVTFFPNSIWLSHHIQIPPIGNRCVNW